MTSMARLYRERDVTGGNGQTGDIAVGVGRARGGILAPTSQHRGASKHI
jgi:hypothetical protein